MFQIHWSETAKDTYSQILTNLSQDSALKLDDKVEALIEKLKSFRHFCPPSELHPNIRRCTISKYISLSYHIDGHVVSLLQFYYNKSSIDW